MKTRIFPAPGPSEPWSYVDHTGLARYVTRDAGALCELPVNRANLLEEDDGYARIAQAIYDALLEKRIRYAPEPFHPALSGQLIRSPAEILNSPREGTCLDLVTLFCGIALANELLPMVIVLEGHALAAICTTHGLRDWSRPRRPGSELFSHSPILDDADKLKRLLGSGNWLAIECTGLARGNALNLDAKAPETRGRIDGVMPFERAKEAALEQLNYRKTSFAVEIALAHLKWNLGPPTLTAPAPVQAIDPIASHIRTGQFKALIGERTRNFIGRDFAFAAIDKHLADPAFEAGYIMVHGAPGVGKTAFMAELVAQRGYIHHFNIAAENIRSTRAFLESVCAQLIVRYDLRHLTLPPGFDEDSGVLNELLNAATSAAGTVPVVIAVDALDEAELPGAVGANVLYLPRSLPKGAYFIVSRREFANHRLRVDQHRDVDLQNDEPVALSDVRAYAERFMALYGATICPLLTQWRISEQQFVSLITERSAGNFMYISYVLNDIFEKRLTPEMLSDVSRLPRDLSDYYEQHWQMMKRAAGNRFDRVHEAMLSILTVARAPLTLGEIKAYALLLAPGIAISQIKDALQDWCEFLVTSMGAHEPLYRVYHASFRDFLSTKIDAPGAHDVIARAALARLAMQSGQPLRGLTDYERDNLLAHLLGAGQESKVHRILALETPTRRNAWFELQSAAGRVAEYRADIALAQRLALAQADRAKAAGEPSAALGLALRYALMSASVNSLAQNVPPTVLAMAARCGFTTLNNALELARAVPEPNRRGRSLLELLPLIPAAERGMVGDEIMAACASDFDGCADVLVDFAKTLVASQIRTLRKLTYAVSHMGDGAARLLNALIPLLSEDRLNELLCDKFFMERLALGTNLYAMAVRASQAVREKLLWNFEQSDDHAREFCHLVAASAQHGEITEQRLERAVRGIREDDWRLARDESSALLWRHVPPQTQTLLLEDGWQRVMSEGARKAPAMFARCYVRYAGEAVHARLLELARECSLIQRLHMLLEIIPHSAGDILRTAVAIMLDSITAAFSSPLRRLCALADLLTATERSRLLTLALAMNDDYLRFDALASILRTLDGADDKGAHALLLEKLRKLYRDSVEQDAHAGGFQVRNELNDALAAFAPCARGEVAREVWQMAQAILDEPFRTHGILPALKYLDAPHRERVMAGLFDANERTDENVRIRNLHALCDVSLIPRHLHRRARHQAFQLANPVARAAAIAAIAPVIAPWRRDAIVEAAFRQSEATAPRSATCANALADLIDAATPTLRQKLLPAAIAAAEDVDGPATAVRIMVRLMKHLPDEAAVSLWNRAFDRADEAEFGPGDVAAQLLESAPAPLLKTRPWLRLFFSSRMDEDVALWQARHEPISKVWPALMDCREEGKSYWPDMLCAAAPRFSLKHVRAAQEFVQEVGDQPRRDAVRASLLSRLAALGKWEEAHAEFWLIQRPATQLSTLLTIARHAPAATHDSLVHRVLGESMRIESSPEMIDLRRALVQAVAERPDDLFMPVRGDVIHGWSRMSRLRLVGELFDYSAVIAGLGGPESLGEVIRAVDDVGRWWP